MLREVWDRNGGDGGVCVFDLVEEGGTALSDAGLHDDAVTGDAGGVLNEDEEIATTSSQENSTAAGEAETQFPPPNWTLSDPMTEKKSLFLAHAAPCASVAEAKSHIAHLLASNKRVASATHNITAWRIRSQQVNEISDGVSAAKGSIAATAAVFQDCDDDGETAAGGRLLHLLQLMDVWGLVVVVTRWYGGVKLGPDRFRLINSVARDAVVKGEFAREKENDGPKGKKKGR